ncbi:7tm 6 domain containing protein, partial [Asbolus verrucosus]
MVTYNTASHFDDTDDVLIILRKIFLDFGYSRVAKMFSTFCICFYSVAYLLEIYFIITHFNKNLVLKYFPEILMFTYLIINMIVLIFLEKPFLKMQKSVFATARKINSAGERAKAIILKKSSTIMSYNFFAIGLFIFCSIILFPMWSYDYDEILLCPHVLEAFFGNWSKIPYFLYFAGIPFLNFFCMKFSCILLYYASHIQMQIFLLSEHITQISKDFDCVNEWNKIHSVLYQNEMYRRLSFCIQWHVELRRSLRIFLTTVNSVMGIFVVLGTLYCASTTFFILYNIEILNIISKVRVLFVASCSVVMVIMFCESGQKLVNETGRIFDTLLLCPWYIWNPKIRQSFLLFLTNSVRPIQFSFAGITLNRLFIIT